MSTKLLGRITIFISVHNFVAVVGYPSVNLLHSGKQNSTCLLLLGLFVCFVLFFRFFWVVVRVWFFFFSCCCFLVAFFFFFFVALATV